MHYNKRLEETTIQARRNMEDATAPDSLLDVSRVAPYTELRYVSL